VRNSANPVYQVIGGVDVFPRVLIITLKITLKYWLQAHNLSSSMLSGVESTRNEI
jgi:hypothetical protein